MYSVTKTYGHDLGLSACFRQHRATSHCAMLHGYALSFKFTFEGEQLDENGWLLDFGSLKWLKEWLVKMFDHKLLVAMDDPKLDEICALANEHEVADIIVCEHGVGCEAFAKLAYEFVEAYFAKALEVVNEASEDDEPATMRVRLASVEVREHGANSAIYHGEKA